MEIILAIVFVCIYGYVVAKISADKTLKNHFPVWSGGNFLILEDKSLLPLNGHYFKIPKDRKVIGVHLPGTTMHMMPNIKFIDDVIQRVEGPNKIIYRDVVMKISAKTNGLDILFDKHFSCKDSPSDICFSSPCSFYDYNGKITNKEYISISFSK